MAVAALAVGMQTPEAVNKTPVSYADVRLVDWASQRDTIKLMSARADGRKGVMYLDGQKDTAPSGWAQGLLNKYTRQAMRNASRDVDVMRRRREGTDVPPGACLRVSDDYLQIRDARFEAFVHRGPSGAMAAKAMDTVADGWAATLTQEMIVGCSSSVDDNIIDNKQAATSSADNNAEEIVTIWWALGNDEESKTGAARLPGESSTKSRRIDTVAPGDAILVRGRTLSDTSAGPVAANGADSSVFWWYGLTLSRIPNKQMEVGENSSGPQTRALEGQDPRAAAAAAEAADSISGLQPIIRPWPTSTDSHPYAEPGYTNQWIDLVEKIDRRAERMPNLPTAETIIRAVSELSEHKRVLTERATTRMEGFADGVKTIADQAIEIATRTTAETRAAVGTKVSMATEWLSTDPLRRYLSER